MQRMEEGPSGEQKAMIMGKLKSVKVIWCKYGVLVLN